MNFMLNVVTLYDMNQFLRHWIVVLFLFFCSLCHSMQEYVQAETLVVLSSKTIDTELIARHFPTDILVKKISFQSDTTFQKEEFFHLLGFKENDQINQKYIIAALERFLKKNKFVSITIHISQSEDSMSLHFIFESEWTFRKIKIHNV